MDIRNKINHHDSEEQRTIANVSVLFYKYNVAIRSEIIFLTLAVCSRESP